MNSVSAQSQASFLEEMLRGGQGMTAPGLFPAPAISYSTSDDVTASSQLWGPPKNLERHLPADWSVEPTQSCSADLEEIVSGIRLTSSLSPASFPFQAPRTTPMLSTGRQVNAEESQRVNQDQGHYNLLLQLVQRQAGAFEASLAKGSQGVPTRGTPQARPAPSSPGPSTWLRALDSQLPHCNNALAPSPFKKPKVAASSPSCTQSRGTIGTPLVHQDSFPNCAEGPQTSECSPVSSELSAEEKRRRRQASNREAARRMRKRHSDKVAELVAQIDELKGAHCIALRQLEEAQLRISSLEDMNRSLRANDTSRNSDAGPQTSERYPGPASLGSVGLAPENRKRARVAGKEVSGDDSRASDGLVNSCLETLQALEGELELPHESDSLLEILGIGLGEYDDMFL